MFDWLLGAPLSVGSVAPDFRLRTDDGRSVTLSEFHGRQNVVLVFYPKDDTSLCTRQLCEFRDSWAAAAAADTVVFGVNPGSEASHQTFRQKFQLPYPLLVDEGQKVARLYGSQGLIVRRTVYLVGKSGLIRFAGRGVPKPAEVLAAAEVSQIEAV